MAKELKRLMLTGLKWTEKELRDQLDTAVTWRQYYESGNIFMRILKVCLR